MLHNSCYKSNAKKKSSFSSVMICLILLYQDAIGVLIPAFLFVDEIESIFVLFIMFAKFSFIPVNLSINRNMYSMFLSWIIFCFFTIMGNIRSLYQSPFYVIFDIFTFSKFFINICAGYYLFQISTINKLSKKLYKVSKVTTYILFVLCLHDTFMSPFFPYLSDRYNTRSLMLFFSNQTYLAQMAVTLIVIQFSFGRQSFENDFLIILDAFIAVSTFRTKVLGWLAIALVIIFWIERRQVKRFFAAGIFLFFGMIAVGWKFIDRYFIAGADSSVRFLILAGGIVLANRFFPFGAGFGTYCSAASTIHSTLAYDYAGNTIKNRIKTIFNVNEMIKNGPIHDMYWAMLIGQSGYLGSLLYTAFVLRIVKITSVFCGKYSKRFWSIVLVLLYLGIASIGETSFSSWYVINFGLFIGFLLKLGKEGAHK